jgi:hypothetical protein
MACRGWRCLVTAPHTSDLDHDLAAVLHEADSAYFHVMDRAADGTPTLYRVVLYSATTKRHYSGISDDRGRALAAAKGQLRAGAGGTS